MYTIKQLIPSETSEVLFKDIYNFRKAYFIQENSKVQLDFQAWKNWMSKMLSDSKFVQEFMVFDEERILVLQELNKY